MITFNAKTADNAWSKIASTFKNASYSKVQDSRLGKTLELLHTGITIEDPRQRWILSRKPPINPAFAIAEVVWIVNGRNDSAYLNYWNSKLHLFAGNGKKYYGAYGFRLRKSLGIDQLKRAYHVLMHDKNSRQVVLQIWDATKDLPKRNGNPANKDIPCNIISVLKVREQKLEWLQILRSNDFFLGIPYNIIQFTTLQEILAGWIGVEPGTYNHISDSLHVYEKDIQGITKGLEYKSKLVNSDRLNVPYKNSKLYFTYLDSIILRLVYGKVNYNDLQIILSEGILPPSYKNLLFILLAEHARKNKYYELMNEIIEQCTNKVLIKAWYNWKERIKLNKHILN